MSYELNILVNGNRCKQYQHDGKIFVEAKKGSEYAIEIKNNVWKRILAVCSVDGLNILDGKSTTQDGPGYVINSYNSCVFDGFRVSNDKVAKFVFDYKDKSYAADKHDGSIKNVGVIGVSIFDEHITPPAEIHHHWNTWPTYIPPKPSPWDYPHNPIIWCGTNTGDSISYGNTCGSTNTSYEDNVRSDMDNYNVLRNATKCSAGNKISAKTINANFVNCCQELKPDPKGFDMGTKWGNAKESKAIEVEFERGSLVFSTSIYYASRQSLIEMGIPLGNEKQIHFPSAFADSKYAKPPTGWNG